VRQSLRHEVLRVVPQGESPVLWRKLPSCVGGADDDEKLQNQSAGAVINVGLRHRGAGRPRRVLFLKGLRFLILAMARKRGPLACFFVLPQRGPRSFGVQFVEQIPVCVIKSRDSDSPVLFVAIYGKGNEQRGLFILSPDVITINFRFC
jgi:hypothetical protein